MDTACSYWLVGATWSGEDQADAFYRRGYWELGYEDEDQPGMAHDRDSIRPDDRIAIKSMRGRGAATITVKGIGVVKEVADGKVYIEWKVIGMSREVHSKGCFASIHGPYTLSGPDAAWVREVFCL